jgi:radical SAM superfamily enzyme YgiQ (UPF0313 family)
MCRGLGIRVVAGFMIGFPEDTRESIRDVLRYAKRVNPFAANFNVCTPYPGTGFIEEIKDQIAHRDWTRYDVYTPNLKYEHLTADEVQELHRKCFTQYYFRREYLMANWRFLFPRLFAAFSVGKHSESREAAPAAQRDPVTQRDGVRIDAAPAETAIGVSEPRSSLTHLGDMGLVSTPHSRPSSRKRSDKWI